MFEGFKAVKKFEEQLNELYKIFFDIGSFHNIFRCITWEKIIAFI